MIENVTDGEPRTLDPRALIWRGEYYNRNGDAAQHEKDDPDGDGDPFPVSLARCRSNELLKYKKLIMLLKNVRCCRLVNTDNWIRLHLICCRLVQMD